MARDGWTTMAGEPSEASADAVDGPSGPDRVRVVLRVLISVFIGSSVVQLVRTVMGPSDIVVSLLVGALVFPAGAVAYVALGRAWGGPHRAADTHADTTSVDGQ